MTAPTTGPIIPKLPRTTDSTFQDSLQGYIRASQAHRNTHISNCQRRGVVHAIADKGHPLG